MEIVHSIGAAVQPPSRARRPFPPMLVCRPGEE